MTSKGSQAQSMVCSSKGYLTKKGKNRVVFMGRFVLEL